MMRHLALVLLLAVGWPGLAAGQSTNTALQAQVNKLSASLNRMDSTVKKLEARVAKLEKASDEEDEADVKDEAEEAEDERHTAELERRIAALERNGGPAKGNTSSTASSRVRAPFVVEDDDGRVILRVSGGKSPRLMIGEDQGGQVELGTGSAGGGIVRVRDASNTDRVILVGSEGWGQVRAMSRTHSAILNSNDETLGAVLSLFKGDTPTVRLNSGVSGWGGLKITDPQGEEAVSAGSIPGEHGTVGMVRVGPRRRVGALGPQSILQGKR